MWYFYNSDETKMEGDDQRKGQEERKLMAKHTPSTHSRQNQSYVRIIYQTKPTTEGTEFLKKSRHRLATLLEGAG